MEIKPVRYSWVSQSIWQNLMLCESNSFPVILKKNENTTAGHFPPTLKCWLPATDTIYGWGKFKHAVTYTSPPENTMICFPWKMVRYILYSPRKCVEQCHLEGGGGEGQGGNLLFITLHDKQKHSRKCVITPTYTNIYLTSSLTITFIILSAFTAPLKVFNCVNWQSARALAKWKVDECKGSLCSTPPQRHKLSASDVSNLSSAPGIKHTKKHNSRGI